MIVLELDVEEVDLFCLVKLKGSLRALNHAEVAHVLMIMVVAQNLQADVGEVDVVDFADAVSADHGRVPDTSVDVFKLEMVDGAWAGHLDEAIVQPHKGKLSHIDMEVPKRDIVDVDAAYRFIARVF